jgi:hypothetical protein
VEGQGTKQVWNRWEVAVNNTGDGATEPELAGKDVSEKERRSGSIEVHNRNLGENIWQKLTDA